MRSAEVCPCTVYCISCELTSNERFSSAYSNPKVIGCTKLVALELCNAFLFTFISSKLEQPDKANAPSMQATVYFIIVFFIIRFLLR